MTTRRRIGLSDVIDTAVDLVEAEGSAALTLSRVARLLGIKTPSLYSHVTDLDGLERHIALRAIDELGDDLSRAAMGRSGPDALAAVANTFRQYAVSHPGMYELSARTRPDDHEYASAGLRALSPVTAILREFDLDETEAIHAARMLRSALHGFALLEINQGFGLDVDVDESFEWMIRRLGSALVAQVEPIR